MTLFPRIQQGAESLQPTPTDHELPYRIGGFNTLADCLDYAARGRTGMNFYDGRGRLSHLLPYTVLREQAVRVARRFTSLNIARGERVALVASTSPDFVICFFACQYAGLVPVPLPAKTYLVDDDEYARTLRNFLDSCQPRVGVSPDEFSPHLKKASEGAPMNFCGAFDELLSLPASDSSLDPVRADELAYIQYTSGSTKFPRGVMMQSSSVMDNLSGIMKNGVLVTREDRCVSWLPFYHDMGLVGLMLTPIAAQRSGDYLDTRSFAVRPRLWLDLLHRTKASVSFSPPFGYELCNRRLRREEALKYDLSNWRVAGVGAEMIREDTLTQFSTLLAPARFNGNAFLPCYGMAECSLAVSFAELNTGVRSDHVNRDRLSNEGIADPANPKDAHVSSFVICGKPLPNYGIEIRDQDGQILPDRHVGRIFVRGSSTMSGYFRSPEATKDSVSEDGWLNTGDLGYLVAGELVVTGRQKDLIIIAGRNIWPQDIEYLAESQEGIRTGDALAFSAPGEDGNELAVVVVQSREADPGKRAVLVKTLKGRIRQVFGINCRVQLEPMHTLPRTSSGKLSRSRARSNFMRGYDWSGAAVEPATAAEVAGKKAATWRS